MKKQLILGMALSAMILNSCGPKVPQLGQATIDEVINAMSFFFQSHGIDDFLNWDRPRLMKSSMP